MKKTDIRYKVRDKVTGKFWNGETRRSIFNDEGKIWNRLDTIESNISYFIKWRNSWGTSQPYHHGLPSQWEVVELKVSYNETNTHSLSDYINYQNLRNEISKVDNSFAYFTDVMRKKGQLDKIEFIFKIKPREGEWNVSFDRIKEARAQLRQLGVKTRTFKEYNGMFGLVDRNQALKARLTLDVDKTVDLGKMRTDLKI